MRTAVIRQLGNIVILVLLLLAVLPFIFMAYTSLQHTQVLSLSLVGQLDFSNYVSLFTTLGFGQALLTSTVVVVLGCIVNLIVSSLAAYGFAKKPFPGSEKLFWLYLVTMMVPSQVTLIPLFSIMQSLGLLNTYVSLFLPVINAFGVFLIRQFIVSLPDDLFEAARIDGASDLRVFYSIVLPLIRPVLVALTVFTFITLWNDFLWPLVSITSDSMQTVTLAAANLQGEFTTQYGLVMAGATVSFLVPLIVYVLLQKQFVGGIASTGLKG